MEEYINLNELEQKLFNLIDRYKTIGNYERQRACEDVITVCRSLAKGEKKDNGSSVRE